MPNKAWAKALTGTVAVAVLGLAGCGQGSTTNNVAANQTAVVPPAPKYSGAIVATYKGGKLTKQELDQQYNLQVVLPGQAQNESKSKFLTYYITWYKYLYQKAKAKGDTKVDATQASQTATSFMQNLASQLYKSQAGVNQKLKSLGLTKNDVVLYFIRQQYIQQYLADETKNVTVSTAQAQTYYHQNKQDYLQVTVDHILAKDQKTAQSVESQLKQGKQFTELAVQDSQDPTVKNNMGRLQNVTIAQLASQYGPQFASACQKAPIGKIQSPVQTQYGYDVLRVDSRKQLTFAQAKSVVKEQLLPQAKQQKMLSLYHQAEQKAGIKVTANGKAL